MPATLRLLTLVAAVALGLLVLRTVLVWGGGPPPPADARQNGFADVIGPDPALSPEEVWRPERALPPPLPAPFTDLGLTIPVAGVAAHELRGSFAETRGAGRVHRAIDIPAPRGTPVVAAADGRVVSLTRGGSAGTAIVQLDARGEYAFFYAHLDGYARGLDEGQAVERGEVIGYVGTSGNAPPGVPHLHFQVRRLADPGRWWSGTPVDPLPLLGRAEAATDAPAP